MNYPKSWGPNGCCDSGVNSTHHRNAVRNLEDRNGPTRMGQNLVALAVAAGIVIGLLLVLVLSGCAISPVVDLQMLKQSRSDPNLWLDNSFEEKEMWLDIGGPPYEMNHTKAVTADCKKKRYSSNKFIKDSFHGRVSCYYNGSWYWLDETGHGYLQQGLKK